jgi:hypothetical protein
MLHIFIKNLMMKKAFLFLIILFAKLTIAQNSEILMFDIKPSGTGFTLSNMVNISKNKGYDNQPFVKSEEKKLLFTSKRDSISTEIYEYDYVNNKIKRLTNNKENEYSPKIISPSNRCMVVKGPEQRLSLYSEDYSSEDTILVSNDSIGYYCYLGKGKIAANVLTKSHSLQLIDTSKLVEPEFIAGNVGRTILEYRSGILYVQLGATKNDVNKIAFYDNTIKSNIHIIDLPPGKEDFIVHEQKIYTVIDEKLFECNLEEERNWKEVADFNPFKLKGITRIAVNQEFSKLFVVATEEDWMFSLIQSVPQTRKVVTQKKSVSNKSVEDNKTNSAPLKTVKQPLPKK